jgi:nucleoside-diphosphate-sugar epimerase
MAYCMRVLQLISNSPGNTSNAGVMKICPLSGVRSCYDEGKRVAETLMFDYHRQHGIGIYILSPSVFL